MPGSEGDCVTVRMRSSLSGLPGSEEAPAASAYPALVRIRRWYTSVPALDQSRPLLDIDFE